MFVLPCILYIHILHCIYIFLKKTLHTLFYVICMNDLMDLGREPTFTTYLNCTLNI